MVVGLALALQTASVTDSGACAGRHIAPLHVVAQYAGNIGLVSVGVGTRIAGGRATAGVLYGYLPRSRNDVEAHTIALKAGYLIRVHDISASSASLVYCGAAIAYTITRNTFIALPEQFPEGYYKPNALHVLPYVGAGIERGAVDGRRTTVYCELGTSDEAIYQRLLMKSRNTGTLLNLAVGIVVAF
jgi:hypothetical protein